MPDSSSGWFVSTTALGSPNTKPKRCYIVGTRKVERRSLIGGFLERIGLAGFVEGWVYPSRTLALSGWWYVTDIVRLAKNSRGLKGLGGFYVETALRLMQLPKKGG